MAAFRPRLACVRSRLVVLFVPLLAIAGLGAGLAASEAAATVTIGRADLTTKPINSAECTLLLTTCSITMSQASAATGSSTVITVPGPGAITGWRFVGGATGESKATFALRVLRLEADELRAVSSSPPVENVNGGGSLITLASPLRVQAGDLIGVTIFGEGNSGGPYVATVDASGGLYRTAGTALPDGTSFGFVNSEDEELLLNAEVQLDTGPPPPPPTADTTMPVLSGLTIAPAKFVAANTGPGLISAKVGAQLSYKLSEMARTTLTVERALPGFRKGKSCVAKRPNGAAKPCRRYAKVNGSLTHDGAAGLNSLRFMGRIGNKSLKEGRYRLSAVAADAAGNSSEPQRLSFKIVK
jgi:hypothetical protein